jgi:DNA-binding LacI/PurR family transcriptional regulator
MFKKYSGHDVRSQPDMTTIKDVAKLAGVSIATVSATINGTATVSERLSRRVREAIDLTGYSPHGIARSLRLGRSQSYSYGHRPSCRSARA